MRRSRQSDNLEARPERSIVIRMLQALAVCLARIYHQLIVRTPPRLPRMGAAILVCNHTSGLDPILIQAVCPRLIIWMMAAEYYDIPVLGWIFRRIGIIPTTRDGRDMAATRAALRSLQQGRILGIFPEGRIEPTHDLLPFQVGVALMAIKTGVPVYPAYLDGTQRNKEMLQAFLIRNNAVLSFGPAVDFDRTRTDRESLTTAIAKIEQAVRDLKAKMDERR